MTLKNSLSALFCCFGLSTVATAGMIDNIRGYCDPYEVKGMRGANLYDFNGSALQMKRERMDFESETYYDRRYAIARHDGNGIDVKGSFPINNNQIVVVDKKIGLCYITPANPDTSDEDRDKMFKNAPKYFIREPLVA